MLEMSGENSYPRGLLKDFSGVCPDGLVTSSEGLGWQNARVMQFHHSRREMIVPPLANTLVMLNLSPSINLTASINGQEFSRRLEEGDSVILPAGMPSEWRYADGQSCEMLHIYLEPDFLRRTSEGSDVDTARITIEAEFGVRDPHILHIGMSLLQELNHASWAGKAYADLLATALVVHLLRKHRGDISSAQHYSGGLPRYKLRRVIDYINDKLGEELRVADLAGEVEMSLYHFARLFKRATGLAPHQYIMQKRIEKAKRLLVETELPIAQVALEIGFQSQSRFTTLFRHLTCATPRAYRRQNTSLTFSLPAVDRARLSYEADRYLNVA